MTQEDTKKHPCPDCICCQWCSDDRCRLCRTKDACRRRKLSFDEQIALYESLNSSPKPACGQAVITSLRKEPPSDCSEEAVEQDKQ